MFMPLQIQEITKYFTQAKELTTVFFNTKNNSNKSNRIKEILSSGNKIKKLIISYGLSEKEAFVAESALINIMNYIDSQSLTNVVSGHHTAPVITAEDFENTIIPQYKEIFKTQL